MQRWVIGAAALMAFGVAGQAQDTLPSAEDAPPQIDEIALAKDRYERMTVPVTIEGQGPYRFFIDTGAQATVVTHRIMEALQIQPTGRANLVAMGSSRTVQTVEVDGLEFANRSISGLVSPLLDARNVGADGILGLDTLQDMRVLIDFREQRLSVSDATADRSDNEYEIVVRARRRLGQMIIADAKVNNVRTAVIIDTGSQNSVGNRALFDRLRARHQDVQISTDVNGVDLTSDLAFIKRLTIGDMELTEVPIGFAESPAFAALGYTDQPALILGMANLRIFERVAIDFPSRRVLFDLPASVGIDPLRNKTFFPPRGRS